MQIFFFFACLCIITMHKFLVHPNLIPSQAPHTLLVPQYIFTGVHNSPEWSDSWGKAAGQAGSQAGCGHCAPAPCHSMLSGWSDLGKPTKKSVDVNLALFDRAKLRSSCSKVGGGRKGWWAPGGRKNSKCMFAVLLPAEFVPDICWYLPEFMAESSRKELEEQAGESQPQCPPAATQPGPSPTPCPQPGLWGILSSR